MLTWFRKNMKSIMIVVAVLFAASMFYGLGYRGLRGFTEQASNKFLKINGSEVDPQVYRQIFTRLRSSFPQNLKPPEALYLQNLALSQTIDFSIMLSEAKRSVRVSGRELNQAVEEIAKNQKFPSVNDFKEAVKKAGYNWDDFKKIVRNDMLVQKMVNQVKSGSRVDPKDLREIKASHILVKDEALARQLLEKIKKGEDFSALAKKNSLDPGSKDKGGDLGYFGTGMMVKPFEDLAFSLKVGEVGGPVKTDFGYHIIKVEDARLKKFPGSADPEKAILQEKQERAFRDWFYKLKQKAKVEIEDPSLRALDLRFKGRIGEAVLEYQKAIKATPNNAYLHLYLGTLYDETGKHELAISEYQSAARLEPGDPSMYLTLGSAYLKNKQAEAAAEQFKKASMIAGDNKPLHEELLKLFNELKLRTLAAGEREEIRRIEKREAFEKELQEKAKVKSE